MATPHIEAKDKEIAQVVLMPGDPVRAAWIAGEFLSSAVKVSDVRKNGCYTGVFDGERVSVMSSGMGMPSIGIYSYELFKEYGVCAIIRIGSAGAYSGSGLGLRDVVLADAAWTESSFGAAQSLDESDWQYPSEKLNDVIKSESKKAGIPLTCGPIHSSDVFYHEPEADRRLAGIVREKGLLCVEMESAALFHNAAVLGKDAACLLTISDIPAIHAALSSDERATSFKEMTELALRSAVYYLREQKRGK